MPFIPSLAVFPRQDIKNHHDQEVLKMVVLSTSIRDPKFTRSRWTELQKLVNCPQKTSDVEKAERGMGYLDARDWVLGIHVKLIGPNSIPRPTGSFLSGGLSPNPSR